VEIQYHMQGVKQAYAHLMHTDMMRKIARKMFAPEEQLQFGLIDESGHEISAYARWLVTKDED